jgi:hypothetical protein
MLKSTKEPEGVTVEEKESNRPNVGRKKKPVQRIADAGKKVIDNGETIARVTTIALTLYRGVDMVLKIKNKK